MADNLTTQSSTLASIPASSVIATDDAGAGGHVQIVKLAVSTDGSATALTADNTDGLLVNLGNNNDVTLATLPDTAAGDLAAINTAVSGTLTVGSHAVTNAGTFAVQVDGDALTALQLIDDIIYVDDADWTDGSSKHALIGGLYQSSQQTITDGDVGPLQVDANGNIIESNSAAILADTAAMDTNLATLAGAVSGSEMQVDIVSSAAVPVTDNSGSLTVDAANDGSLNVTIGDGSNTATIRNLASNDALNVAIVDGAGNQVTSFGGSGGTSATDDSAFTAGSGSGTPVMGFASADTVDSGDVGVLAMDTSRRLLVSIEADNVGIGGGTQYTEDDAAPANPVGNAFLAERDDALGGLTPIEGDWTHLFTDANGALWVIPSGTVTVQEASAMDVSAATVTVDNGGTFAVQVDNIDGTEDAAADADPTGAVLIGVRDDEVGGTAVTSADGDYSALRTDMFGALKTTQLADATSEIKYAVIDAASSGDNTIVAAVGVGVKVRVLAAFMVAAGDVTARFESGAAGTALTGQMSLTTNSGFVLPFCPGGWFETADNTLLNLELSGATSVDGSLVYVEI